MYIPESKLYKPNTDNLPNVLEEGEVALAMVQLGLNSKVLTNRRLLFLDTLDSKVKEFISLEKVASFSFGSTLGQPRVDAVMKDGSTVKIGTFDLKWLDDVKRVFNEALSADTRSPEEGGHSPVSADAAEQEPVSEPKVDGQSADVSESQAMVRTNSLKAFPKWLQASIHQHKRDDEELLMVITEPYTNHQGALLVFHDRCMIVKGGLMGSFMAGSLGGERAGTFYFTQITGIEYNSGMLNGVLEILTPSYQGTANKDFWRASNKSRNADKNDPWTLSNCLPLTKDGYKSAREMIDELKKMVADSQTQKTAPAAMASISDELAKLGDLHSKGLLTDDEFLAAKAKLLG